MGYYCERIFNDWFFILVLTTGLQTSGSFHKDITPIKRIWSQISDFVYYPLSHISAPASVHKRTVINYHELLNSSCPSLWGKTQAQEMKNYKYTFIPFWHPTIIPTQSFVNKLNCTYLHWSYTPTLASVSYSTVCAISKQLTDGAVAEFRQVRTSVS